MTNCKFYGFMTVVLVREQCKVVMKDCLVDLTIKGPYGGEANPMAMPVVSDTAWEQSRSGHCVVAGHASPVTFLISQIPGEGAQSMIKLTNCQLRISCAYICRRLTFGFVEIMVGVCPECSCALLENLTYNAKQ
jgi:hypothetical protein